MPYQVALDKTLAGPLPDYDNLIAVPQVAQHQRIAAFDTPEAHFADTTHLITIGYELRLRVYLVWRFGPPGQGILYTLGTRDWVVRFWAGAGIPPKGIITLATGAIVTADAGVARLNHADPLVTGPTANQSDSQALPGVLK